MRKLYMAALPVAVGLSLAGCRDKAPTGQVAAKVGGEEITVREVQAELNGFNAPDAKTRKRAEQQALQNIIQRKLLAKAAASAGIDKSPEFAIQKTRMEDTLLVQAWQSNLVNAVPNPAPEQVRQYISQHPELFANHKVFEVDQLRMGATNDPKLMADLKPLNTLEDIGRLLQTRGVRFETGRGTIDSFAVGTQVVAQIEKLPPGEVFVLPVGNMLVANKITEAKVVPVPDDVATKLATQYIKAEQAQESVKRMFGSAIANHPKTKVVYNKAYEPPAPANGASAKDAAGGKAG